MWVSQNDSNIIKSYIVHKQWLKLDYTTASSPSAPQWPWGWAEIEADMSTRNDNSDSWNWEVRLWINSQMRWCKLLTTSSFFLPVIYQSCSMPRVTLIYRWMENGGKNSTKTQSSYTILLIFLHKNAREEVHSLNLQQSLWCFCQPCQK